MVTKIDKAEHETIAARVKRGDKLRLIGDDYGVSRERIRQIAADAGVTARRVFKKDLNERISEDAVQIIEDRENWIPARFSTRGFTRKQFELFLIDHNRPLYDRWYYATLLPSSSTGVATPNGRKCVTCHLRKPWSEFYSSKHGINGKSQRCVPCTKEMADFFRRKRNVTEPTVDSKTCTHCKKLKDADKFSRSTTATSGLQSWCKDCQRDAG
jgi:hypothetical protein